jgi:hypothetical protein
MRAGKPYGQDATCQTPTIKKGGFWKRQYMDDSGTKLKAAIKPSVLSLKFHL